MPDGSEEAQIIDIQIGGHQSIEIGEDQEKFETFSDLGEGIGEDMGEDFGEGDDEPKEIKFVE